MALKVFYRWMPEGDPAGAGAPRPAPSSPDRDQGPAPRAPQPDPDSELEIEKKWLQLSSVDPDRFDYFYDKYHDRIFSFAFWRTGDEDAATDVVAETFLTAWEKRGQFRWQGYSFGAWLFQIARGVINGLQRWEKVRRESEYNAALHEVPDDRTPEVEFEAVRNGELIAACLGHLTPGQHEVIVLHHFVGLSVRQIALVTRTPQGTVNSHLRRGRTALRRRLQEHGPAGGLSDEALTILGRAAADEAGLRVVADESGDD